MIEGCLPTSSFGLPRRKSEGKLSALLVANGDNLPRRMERTGFRHGAQRIEAVTGHGFEFVDAPLGFMLDSRVQRGLFRRVGSVRVNGNSADKALIVL